MKTNTLARQRYEQTLAQCATRAKLWKEYVASYQKVLQESPEAFSAFCAEFSERYLRVSLGALSRETAWTPTKHSRIAQPRC